MLDVNSDKNRVLTEHYKLGDIIPEMLALVLSVSLLALGVKGGVISESAPKHHHGRGQSSPELQIITATKDKIEAEYSTAMGSGIRIASEVSLMGGEAVRVTIESTTGETIFEVSRLLGDQGSRSHLSVAGEKFLLVNKTASDGNVEISIYHAPTSSVDSYPAKSMEYGGFASKPKYQRLNSQTAHISGQNAVANLMSHPKTHLIREAAFALGHHIHGRNNPAAMAYYATALRLSKLSDQRAFLEGEDDSSFERGARYRRWGLGWLVDAIKPRKEHCSNSDSDCPKGRCPEGERCRGLCGPECTCWWFICQDCCWNIGCYEHDRICTPNGKHSVECLATAPIGFVCS